MDTTINKETGTVDFSSGEELKQRGMQQAIDHANEVTPKWSELAYQFLLQYAKEHRTFMTEQVRGASVGIIPEPPHDRAWGGVVFRASKAHIIRRIGYNKVKNKKAHGATAAVWDSQIKS